MKVNQVKSWFLRRGETGVPGENLAVQSREHSGVISQVHIVVSLTSSSPPGHWTKTEEKLVWFESTWQMWLFVQALFCKTISLLLLAAKHVSDATLKERGIGLGLGTKRRGGSRFVTRPINNKSKVTHTNKPTRPTHHACAQPFHPIN